MAELRHRAAEGDATQNLRDPSLQGRCHRLPPLQIPESVIPSGRYISGSSAAGEMGRFYG
jgi:hypothetical protein